MSRKYKTKSIQVIVPNTKQEVTYPDDFNETKILARKAALRTSAEMTHAEKIAGSKIVRKNWIYPNATQLFPFQPRHRYCDLLFPFAAGGALAVDEPLDDEDAAACCLKRQHLAKKCIRYVYITRDMSIEQALEQLGEQESWHGQQREMI